MRRLSGRVNMTAVLLMLALGGMGCARRSHYQGIALDGPDTVQGKIQRATAIATPERLARLKSELKMQVPDLTDADLTGMGLTWRATTFHSLTGRPDRTAVYVIVSITDGARHADRVLERACVLLAPEVNPPSASASS